MAVVFLVCDFTIKSLHFSSCVIFNSCPKLFNVHNASELFRHNWAAFFFLRSATLVLWVQFICQHHDSLVCGCMLPTANKHSTHSCLRALAWSNQVSITSPIIIYIYIFFFYCVWHSPCSAQASPPLKPNFHCYVSNKSSLINGVF